MNPQFEKHVLVTGMWPDKDLESVKKLTALRFNRNLRDSRRMKHGREAKCEQDFLRQTIRCRQVHKIASRTQEVRSSTESKTS
jgi:hypothetical protein